MAKKVGKINFCTSIDGNHESKKRYIFYSYDKGSATLDFRLKNQKNEVQDLTDVTVKLLFTGIQDGKERKFTYLDSQPIIENPEEGRILYSLPDKILNYEGEIRGYLYLDFEDGSHSDELSFTFTVVRSKIDSDMEEISEVYIKDFEQIKQEIFELAEREKEAIEALRPKLESSISQLNKQVEELDQKVEVNQIEVSKLLQLIGDNEVITRNELANIFLKGYFDLEKELTFEGKIVGSLVENPNISSSVVYIDYEKGQLPTPETLLSEQGVSGYRALNGEKTESSSKSSTSSMYLPCLRIQWNFVEEMKRWLGEEYFKNLRGIDLEKQIEILEKNLIDITPSTYGWARHSDTPNDWSGGDGGLSSLWYNNKDSQWIEFASNNERDVFKAMSNTVLKKNNYQFLDKYGRVSILMKGEKGYSTSLYYGKTSVKFTYRIYLSDLIYYKRDPIIERMQMQIQELWSEVFGGKEAKKILTE
ncbi:BppU family phage baseplate upper protein [Enterococcus faecalis]|uniref:BppU family phage baseplate upper protein n=1 Tax=Enterococcus faecalis TaxID=1351 RepID=A0AAW7K6E9_ENTFL|nr:BppU family phage baseplate upper protein [Enterococcus faecalis]MDN3191048.1 BppU family phage baseplate upper protein [Enterococcus faecalis]